MNVNGKPVGGAIIALMLCGLLYGTPAQGQPQGQVERVTLGKQFPLCVATAATGKWAKECPFNPAMFGKIRGYNVLGRKSPQVVIGTLSLDSHFLRLAKAVDDFVGRHKELEWSAIQVGDTKGAQIGGYTADEIVQRMKELQNIARQNKLKHLSFVLSSPNADGFSQRLGLTEGSNLLVALVAGNADSKEGVVKWFAQRQSSQMSKQTTQEIIASLEKSVADNK